MEGCRWKLTVRGRWIFRWGPFKRSTAVNLPWSAVVPFVPDGFTPLTTAWTARQQHHFYPRDAMLARIIAIATSLSVRPSVTRRYCVKTKKASGMISSPSGSPKTLVFWRQISSPNSKGFPPNGGLKQGSVGIIQRFSSFKRQYLESGSRYGKCYY